MRVTKLLLDFECCRSRFSGSPWRRATHEKMEARVKLRSKLMNIGVAFVLAGAAGGTIFAASTQPHLKTPPETRLAFQLLSDWKVR